MVRWVVEASKPRIFCPGRRGFIQFDIVVDEIGFLGGVDESFRYPKKWEHCQSDTNCQIKEIADVFHQWIVNVALISYFKLVYNVWVKYLTIILLGGILALGLFVRLAGINFGLPQLMHTDEARIILDSMSMGQRLSLLSEDVNYPLFTKYIFTISYGVYFVAGSLLGYFQDKIDFAVKFLADPAKIVLLSRVVMTMVGSLTMVVAYFWGKIIDKSVKTGLIAALFVAVEWQLVLESQYALHQTMAALSALLAFLGISLIAGRMTKRPYLIAGITMGIAISSHQTSILLVPALLYLFVSDFLDRRVAKPVLFRNWLTFSLMALMFGILGNFNYIFQFRKSLNFFLQGSGAAKVAFSSTPYFSYDILSIFGWYVIELIRRNYIIGALSIFSIFLSLKDRKKGDVIYLITFLTYLIFFKTWAFRWMHLFVSFIPISLIFGARLLSRLTDKLNLSGLMVLFVCLLLIMPNLNDLISMNIAKQLPETRQLALDWIQLNIPAGTKIAIDYPAHAVPIPSIYPAMLRNRLAMDYFDNNIPEEIKRGYFSAIVKEDHYDVIDMIDSKDEPIWPKNMPDDAIARASASTTMRDIYGYFNFKPISEIKASGARYIVITSYTYGMFLLSSDQRKFPLANTYIKDDVLPFLNHDGNISIGTQHELVYYLAKRGREYFLQLLDNKDPDIHFVKEFVPAKNEFGPVVKIYSID